MNRIAALQSIFTQMNESGIEYAVLRNYNFLLRHRKVLVQSEKSIDIAVSAHSLPLFEEEMRKLGFFKRKPQFSLKHRAYFRIDYPDIISFDVQVGGIYWNDMLYLDEKYVVGNRIKKSFLYVPSDDDTFIMLLVHSILGKRYFKPEYAATIASLVPHINKEYVLGHLSEIFGTKAAHTVYVLASNQKWADIVQKKYYYISYFIFKSQRHLATFTLLFLRWLRWKKFFRPAPLISFIGPDGAGKSTMVQALAEYLHHEGRKAAIIYTGRGRGNFLPISAVGRAYKRTEKQKDLHIKPQHGIRRIMYTLAAPIFTVDLLLRYIFHIMPLRRRKCLVITDRYCSDIMVMKHVPVAFKKILLSPFPKPTITFYLYNSPEHLHARRPQEPLEELSRQLNLFSGLRPYLEPMEMETANFEENKKKVIAAVQKLLYREWY